MTIAIACSICLFLAAPASDRLAVIGEAPEFTLTTQAGESYRSSNLRGKVILVSFIFTNCNGTCPATTHRMVQIQDALKASGTFQKDYVCLLSISLDPRRDTPDVLTRYMKLYDADPKLWTFLTGAPEAVNKAVAAWGMWAKPTANGQLDHPSRIYLVDAGGRIREIYNLNFLKPTWVVEDIQLLLRERQLNAKRNR